MHHQLHGGQEGAGFVVAHQTGQAERRDDWYRAKLVDQAVNHCLPDPAAAPTGRDDDVFDVGALSAVGRGAGETDQLPQCHA